jgi:hypothetical protein
VHACTIFLSIPLKFQDPSFLRLMTVPHHRPSPFPRMSRVMDSTFQSGRISILILKFSNVKNMGKPSQFFRYTPIPLVNLVVQVINKSLPNFCPYPSATISNTFTQLGRFCLPPFAYFLQQFSHSHYTSLLPLDISLTTTPNIACIIAL